MDFNKSAWNEKYRPQTLGEIILPKRIKQPFLSNGCLNNILLYGTAGIGKTTLSRILCKGHSTFVINCKDEGSINLIRTSLKEFCMTAPRKEGQMKYVLLDEFDNVSKDFLEGIKPMTEQYAESVKFIATSNYKDKLYSVEGISSRFLAIECNVTEDDIVEDMKIKANNEKIKLFDNGEPLGETLEFQFKTRLFFIAKNENVNIDKFGISKLAQTYLPDFRSAIEHLQAIHLGYETIDSIGKISSGIMDHLFNEKLTPFELFSLTYTNYQNRVDQTFNELSSKLPIKLHDKGLDHLICQSVMICFDYSRDSKKCSDKTNALWVCLAQLQRIIHNE